MMQKYWPLGITLIIASHRQRASVAQEISERAPVVAKSSPIFDDDMVPHAGWLQALVDGFRDENVKAVTGPILPLEASDSNEVELGVMLEEVPWGPERFDVDVSADSGLSEHPSQCWRVAKYLTVGAIGGGRWWRNPPDQATGPLSFREVPASWSICTDVFRSPIPPAAFQLRCEADLVVAASRAVALDVPNLKPIVVHAGLASEERRINPRIERAPKC
jgi:hypothetical protein